MSRNYESRSLCFLLCPIGRLLDRANLDNFIYHSAVQTRSSKPIISYNLIISISFIINNMLFSLFVFVIYCLDTFRIDNET